MSESGANEAALDNALGEYLAWSGDAIATLGAAVEADAEIQMASKSAGHCSREAGPYVD
jgi:hypothetical protein